MKRIIALIILCFFLAPCASAEEIPDAARPIIGDIEAGDVLDPESVLRSIGQRMLDGLTEPIARAMKNASAVLICAVLASLGDTVSLGRSGAGAAKIAGVLGITAAAGSGVGGIIGSLAELCADIRAYSSALLPTVASAAAASGAPASASANLAAATLCINVVLAAAERFIIPLISVLVAVATASAAFDGALRGVFEMLSRTARWLIIGLSTAFTAAIGFTKIVSGAADEAAVKAARTALSTLVPVVGRTISDASEAVAGSFAVLKNTTGVFGILVILALAYTPLVTAAANYLGYKLASSLAQIVAGPEITRLISDIGTAIGYAAATAAVSALALFICVAGFMGTVT